MTQNLRQNSHETEINEIYNAGDENLSAGANMAPVYGAKKRKGPRIFLTLILIIVILAVALVIVSKTTRWNVLGLPKAPANVASVAKASDWQAVFLSNEQVYFGKLKNINSSYPVLEDIYYLQVQEVPIQPAQAATDEAGVQPAVQQTTQQMILVKFGTELHKPMDKMFLNKDHILFYEDLSADSKVVEAINNYKAQPVAETK